MRYKAIITDIDGTLTLPKLGALPTDTVRSAVQKAYGKEVLFSVASARPLRLLEYLVEYVPLKAPIIINNGAEIYDARLKKTVWKTVIDHNTANKILKKLQGYQKFHIDLLRHELVNPTTIPKDAEISKFLIFDLSSKEADEVTKSIEKDFPNLSVTKGGSYLGHDLFDLYIANSDATKQYAVLKFAEVLGIQTHEIIGIGDHYNDFPLLMACGLKVAMGNAVPELKAIADYIAPSIEEDGVADVIEKFILS